MAGLAMATEAVALQLLTLRTIVAARHCRAAIFAAADGGQDGRPTVSFEACAWQGKIFRQPSHAFGATLWALLTVVGIGVRFTCGISQMRNSHLRTHPRTPLAFLECGSPAAMGTALERFK